VLNGPDSVEKEEVKGAAQHVLGTILRLLHPAIPFVTEELWDHFGYGPECSLIRAPWPEAVPVTEAEAAREELDSIIALISEIRSLRADLAVPVKVQGTLWVFPEPDAEAMIFRRMDVYGAALKRLASLADLHFTSQVAGRSAIAGAEIPAEGVRYDLRFGDDVDLAAAGAKLRKARAAAESEVRKVEAKLGNRDFIDRAKEEVVEENRERRATFLAEIARLDAALARING
jgi:valyl-tRNA synthetase